MIEIYRCDRCEKVFPSYDKNIKLHTYQWAVTEMGRDISHEREIHFCGTLFGVPQYGTVSLIGYTEDVGDMDVPDFDIKKYHRHEFNETKENERLSL